MSIKTNGARKIANAKIESIVDEIVPFFPEVRIHQPTHFFTFHFFFRSTRVCRIVQRQMPVWSVFLFGTQSESKWGLDIQLEIARVHRRHKYISNGKASDCSINPSCSANDVGQLVIDYCLYFTLEGFDCIYLMRLIFFQCIYLNVLRKIFPSHLIHRTMHCDDGLWKKTPRPDDNRRLAFLSGSKHGSGVRCFSSFFSFIFPRTVYFLLSSVSVSFICFIIFHRRCPCSERSISDAGKRYRVRVHFSLFLEKLRGGKAIVIRENFYTDTDVKIPTKR